MFLIDFKKFSIRLKSCMLLLTRSNTGSCIGFVPKVDQMVFFCLNGHSNKLSLIMLFDLQISCFQKAFANIIGLTLQCFFLIIVLLMLIRSHVIFKETYISKYHNTQFEKQYLFLFLCSSYICLISVKTQSQLMSFYCQALKCTWNHFKYSLEQTVFGYTKRKEFILKGETGR